MDSLTVVQLKKHLRDKGLVLSGRKADLIKRLRDSEKETEEEVKESDYDGSGGGVVTPKTKPKTGRRKLFSPTACKFRGDPLALLASISAIHPKEDPAWASIYASLHADNKHPATTRTRLSRTDLQLTRYRSEARTIEIRQPFPKDFAAKLTRKEITVFVSSYYGDVFVTAAGSRADCDLIDFAPAYLKDRYHLMGSDVMPFSSRISIGINPSSPPIISYPRDFDAWLGKKEPFLVRMSIRRRDPDGSITHHANCLCVEPLHKTASLFESHGVAHNDIHRIMSMSLQTKGIVFFGLEGKNVRLQGADRLCASWSIYYAMLRMVNPTVPGSAILGSMSDKNLLRLLAWITFDVPQAKPCSLGGVFPGFHSNVGDTLGRDALLSSSGRIVAKALGYRSRFHPDVSKYLD